MKGCQGRKKVGRGRGKCEEWEGVEGVRCKVNESNQALPVLSGAVEYFPVSFVSQLEGFRTHIHQYNLP